MKPRPQPQSRPGEARYTWPQSVTAPPRLTGTAPSAWTGTLERSARADMLGELRGPDGWVLSLMGHAPTRDALALLAIVRTPGLLLPAMDDLGVSSDLTECLTRAWRLGLATVDAGETWRGAVAGTGWVLAVVGTRVGAGRLELMGTVGVANG